MTINPIGASGGLKPLIVVTAPTGSTVTCDSVQGTEVSGTWTFKVALGSHTIVATQGSSTKTETVVVDAVAIYPITISYLPSGCIAEYLFNNNYNDTSGSEYNLTNSASSIVDSGLSGLPKSVSITTSQYCYASNPIMPLNSPLSISVWCKTTQSSSSDLLSNNNGSAKYGYIVQIISNYAIFTLNRGTSGTNNVSLSSNTVVNNGSWHHIVCTWTGDTTTNGAKIYVDNVLKSSATAHGTITKTSYNLNMGKNWESSPSYYTGQLAGVRIYNKVLSTDEIATLYNNGNGI